VGAGEEHPVLITGGAGFIGTNLAHRLLTTGRRVLLFDNLSRPGVEDNLRWLLGQHHERLQVEIADVRDPDALGSAVERAGPIFHFAAQVAVTTSVIDPIHDFEVNARGTLNLLEAVRAAGKRTPILFTSTNKVYGGLDDVRLKRHATRYEPEDGGVRGCGIAEDRPLDLHSPYGCSKGAAEQYMLDYARTFGVQAVVFRMSCIYGPHQFGTEDQGWVAHFLIRALEGEAITLYGDGLQVRDVLFVDDLVDAFLLAVEHAGELAGQVFNIGGGVGNTTSLLELIELIGTLRGARPALAFGDWRLGDQRYYVSDTRRFQRATGWSPRVGVKEGVKQLYDWLLASRSAPSPHPAVAQVAS
jgi:CDP-paratose 2-epimerase